MRQLSLYYRFGERFCNARSGWEERIGGTPVEIVRRRRLCVATVVRDVDDAQAWLDRMLGKINAVSGISGISDTEKQQRIKGGSVLSAARASAHGLCFEAEEHKMLPGQLRNIH